MSRRCVLDASAAAAVVVREPDAEVVGRHLFRMKGLVVPQIFGLEVANVGRTTVVVRTTLIGVISCHKLTPMVKTQIYLREEELHALHDAAKRSGRSVADLVREAIRKVWLRPGADGPVGLWDGKPEHTSADHDTIYDQP